MRPHRVRLTHSLVSNYGLNPKMIVHRPQARSKEQIEEFHCDGESLCLCATKNVFWLQVHGALAQCFLGAAVGR